ncbi:hypothetical protein PSCFBP3800_05684 [Pseudomonas syringae group genomosp. 3]|uniref:Uncharacterized protein n=1 Tax=Pseudomonas amygdali pv. morsprunorum TaxID=129138 RepID=A0A3M2X353_PSEA0|nr:hypothetical protein PSYMP_26758 [Pseudomonas amygdali pv. morsprunorum str. M302280]RML57468.1 hypothetical protein ALQ94_200106 [Pseudomonas amygdali pv. morsprunorum]SPF21127.1 hypothetical protein PSCFBP3800_05684 [Pseudomonas syringae group genomosp. 3]
MNLQHLRIESLCQQFKLDTFATDWPALPSKLLKKKQATPTSWNSFCSVRIEPATSADAKY